MWMKQKPVEDITKEIVKKAIMLNNVKIIKFKSI